MCVVFETSVVLFHCLLWVFVPRLMYCIARLVLCYKFVVVFCLFGVFFGFLLLCFFLLFYFYFGFKSSHRLKASIKPNQTKPVHNVRFNKTRNDPYCCSNQTIWKRLNESENNIWLFGRMLQTFLTFYALSLLQGVGVCACVCIWNNMRVWISANKCERENEHSLCIESIYFT